MTLLIKNVRIIGNGNSGEVQKDVFVSGNRISAIGEFQEKTADRIIEGKGAYLAPGFIDAVSLFDKDLSVFDRSKRRDSLADGVTTLVGGYEGASLAPFFGGRGRGGRVNVDWNSMDELLSWIDRNPWDINIGTFVGWETLHDGCSGEINRSAEMALMSIAEGAIGLSTGRKGLVGLSPERQKRFLQVLGEYKAVFASRTPLGQRFEDHMREVISVSSGNVPVLFTHVTAKEIGRGNYEKVLRELEEGNGWAAVNVSGAGTYSLDFLLPPEALEKEPGTPAFAKSIRKYVTSLVPENITLISVPGHPSLSGLSLRQFMDDHELEETSEGVGMLAAIGGYRSLVECVSGESIPSGLLEHPRVIIGSHSLVHTTCMDFLRRAEEELMPLEEAVSKMTAVPAGLFGFSDRGKVEERYIADLVGFRDYEVKFAVTGGVLTYEHGELAGNAPGRSLRKEEI